MTHATSGPQIFREGEFIIVEFAGDAVAFAHGDRFVFEGRAYVFGPQWEGDTRGIWRTTDGSGAWIAARNIRFIQWEPATISEQLQIPESVAGRSVGVVPMLKIGTTPSAFSFHSDGLRLVRTVAFLDFDGDDARAEIPLIDADGRPWIGPEVPCMMVVRKNDSATDRVSNPSADDVGWTEEGCSFRPGVPTINTGIPSANLIHAYLKPAADPVPHWVLRVTHAGDTQTSSNKMNVLIDLLGQGYGAHATSSRENGSSGVVGHWKTNLVWTQQGFNATPNHTAFSERSFAMHAVDVANDPGVSATVTYLTSDSTSTGTEQFSELPMCDVVADATNGSFNTAAETTWKNETWGMGIQDARSGISTSVKMYLSTVEFDSVASRFKVSIFNTSGRVNAVDPGADTAKDRSFRIYSVGKKA